MSRNIYQRNKKALIICCLILLGICIISIGASHLITYILFRDSSEIIKKAVNEGIYAAYAIFLLKIAGGSLCDKRKKKGSNLFSVPQILFFITMFALKIIFTAIRYRHCELRPISEIIAYVFFVLFIGIAEECTFRGIVAELLLRKYGRSKGGKQYAVFITGSLFAAVHVANIGCSGVIGVICQMCGAFVTGMIFTELYYKNRSLLQTIALHSVIDFFAMIQYGLYGTTTPEKIISSYRPVMLVPYVLVLGLLILRWRRISKK